MIAKMCISLQTLTAFAWQRTNFSNRVYGQLLTEERKRGLRVSIRLKEPGDDEEPASKVVVARSVVMATDLQSKSPFLHQVCFNHDRQFDTLLK